MDKNKVTTIRVFFLVGVMVLMCALKLWYTLPLIFAYALVNTLISKNKSFCYTSCPLGTIQDYGYEKKVKPVKHSKINIIRNIWFIIFWIYIGISIILLFSKPFVLWRNMLYLMFFSMAIALVLQERFSKRYWCVNLCPLGKILDTEMKIIKKIK